MTDLITVETENEIRRLRLNRPKSGNALDTEMLTAVREQMDAADDTTDVSVVVLESAGDVFVAGSDLGEMKDLNPVEYISYLDTFHEAMNAIQTADLPVIAAVDGPAYGGGNVLVDAADLAVATESASFGQQEINVGIYGGTSLVEDLPEKVVNEIVMLGGSIDAAEAERWGLVNRVVPNEEFTEAVDEIAQTLASAPNVALGLAKRTLRAQKDSGTVGSRTAEAFGLSLCFSTDDQVEGMETFLEQRDPEFTDTL